jgi:hypothetical protein
LETTCKTATRARDMPGTLARHQDALAAAAAAPSPYGLRLRDGRRAGVTHVPTHERPITWDICREPRHLPLRSPQTRTPSGTPYPRRQPPTNPAGRQRPAWKENWKDATERSPHEHAQRVSPTPSCPLGQAPPQAQDRPTRPLDRRGRTEPARG